jgi:hypothetical protein
MPFVKLDCGILDSSLWPDLYQREVFITALLMAHPIELRERRQQLHVETAKPTGFWVPPGWYGMVPAAGVGIVRRSGVEDAKKGMAALIALGNTERDSRTEDFGGRRLVRTSGGYIVLNYFKYRDRDYTAAERSQRWRDRQKKKKRGGGA